MKAIILAAGIGSRLHPLTETTPKSLLPVGEKPMLMRSLQSLQDLNIKDILIITGYREDDIKNFVKENFPDLNVQFITNEKYDVTNTGYSLLLAKDFAKDSDFVKFDADVVFEKEILERLLNVKTSALCIDSNINLEAEEVKVITDGKGGVIAVGKKIPPHQAHGESIGIEKITSEAGEKLFTILEELMTNPENHQDYYDDSYTTLVDMGVEFAANDITGLKWVEIDNHNDYALANSVFGS